MRMRIKYYAGFLSILIFLTMVVGSPISANSNSEYLDKVENQLKDSVKINDQEIIDKYVLKSKSEIGKDITIHTDKSNLNFNRATLVKYVDPETKEVLYINNIPISLENGHELTNLSISYDESGEVILHSELYLTQNNEGKFKITSYVNNQKVAEKDTNEKFMTAKEYAEQLEGPQLKFSTSKLAKCLGISMGLADVIGIGCTAACFATAGTGCLVCVAGLAGFAGGNSVCIANAFS